MNIEFDDEPFYGDNEKYKNKKTKRQKYSHLEIK